MTAKSSPPSPENSAEKNSSGRLRAGFQYDPKQIPTEPGCYLYFDEKESVVYVGKAKNLRKRVSSYFQKTNQSVKTASLVKKIRRIETRTVNSEMEALILENNLIKEHKPKYNILLRDDKNFLYLRITNEDTPKAEITRRIVRDGSTYIGPRTSAKSFRSTIRFCQKFFGLKMVRENQDNYVSKLKGNKISAENYRSNIHQMKRFLRGNTKEVLADLKSRMIAFATEKNFEAAAKMRDLIESIGGAAIKQTVELSDTISRDFLGFVREKSAAFFVRLMFRNGKLIDQSEITIHAEPFSEDEDVVSQFLLQFYPYVDELPEEIIIPLKIGESGDIATLLQQNFRGNSDGNESPDRAPKILTAERGDKRKILDIANANAVNFARKTEIESMSQAENFAKALPELAKKLQLEKPPRRIECVDISHFAGQETVASQVVFIDGAAKKSEYRRYKIETLESGQIDDFASMREVMTRRFKGLKNLEKEILKQVQDDSEEEISAENFSIRLLETREEKSKALELVNHVFNQEIDFPSKTEAEYFDEKIYSILGVFNEKKEIVGTLKGKLFNKDHWLVAALAVSRSARKCGLGKKLIIHFARLAEEQSVKKLFLFPDRAVENFYTKLGFQKNEKPINEIQEYLEKIQKKYADTNIIFQSYECDVSKISADVFLANNVQIPAEARKDQTGKKTEPEIKIPAGYEIIRVTETDEIQSAQEKLSELWKSENLMPVSPDKKYEDPKKSAVFLLKKSDTIIGVSRARKLRGKAWKIGSLIVDTAFRGNGLGATFLQFIEQVLKIEFSAEKLTVLTRPKTLRFYERLGFIEKRNLSKEDKSLIEKAREEYNFICLGLEKLLGEKKEKPAEFPDLLVIDGGKGQLSAVLQTLYGIIGTDVAKRKKFDPETQVVALAKREEEIFRGKFKPGKSEIPEIEFELTEIPRTNAASKLLQRARDEAHRFAITYNRNLRGKTLQKSALDEVPGIGPRTKKKLLETFGSVPNIREASEAALIKIVNPKQLKNLQKYL